MTRQQQITKHISKAMRGIEVPWHSPIVPKREGFNCVSLDFFDTATLRQRAKDDPQVADALIERRNRRLGSRHRAPGRSARGTGNVRLHHLLVQFRAPAQSGEIPAGLQPRAEGRRGSVDGVA
jgi:hypothetical protein